MTTQEREDRAAEILEERRQRRERARRAAAAQSSGGSGRPLEPEPVIEEPAAPVWTDLPGPEDPPGDRPTDRRGNAFRRRATKASG